MQKVLEVFAASFLLKNPTALTADSFLKGTTSFLQPKVEIKAAIKTLKFWRLRETGFSSGRNSIEPEFGEAGGCVGGHLDAYVQPFPILDLHPLRLLPYLYVSVNDGDTPSSGMTPCREVRAVNLRDALITPLRRIRLAETNARIFLHARFIWGESSGEMQRDHPGIFEPKK